MKYMRRQSIGTVTDKCLGLRVYSSSSSSSNIVVVVVYTKIMCLREQV